MEDRTYMARARWMFSRETTDVIVSLYKYCLGNN
jgi:hypothetical protein